MNDINIDIFQQLCIFTNKFDVYIEYNKDKEIYDIKLKKIKNERYCKKDIMPGKIYFNNNKKGNFITYKNSKFILVLN